MASLIPRLPSGKVPKPAPSSIEAENERARGSPVVTRPGYLLAFLILTCFATGYAIYWLLGSMRM